MSGTRSRGRAGFTLAVTSLVGLVAFLWPLFVTAPEGGAQLGHQSDAPWVFALVLPLLLMVVLTEVGEGILDAKGIAVLAMLVACGAALRLPGGGLTGFSPVFFLLLPGGRVFGRGFGFVLGALTLFVSALVTGGVGPWLPFQMLAAGWVGFGAGCLPRAQGRVEIAMMAAYGAFAGLAYGLLLDLWFWPFGVTSDSTVSFVAGGGVLDNLGRFWAFHLSTSLGFDLPRAAGNVVLVLIAGRPTLAALRRASRRAAFGAVGTFHDPGGSRSVSVAPH